MKATTYPRHVSTVLTHSNAAATHRQRPLATPNLSVRKLVGDSPAAFLNFTLAAVSGARRRALPSVPWHVARVAAAFNENCGSCAQSAIARARRAGVPPEVLRAVAADAPAELPEPVRDVYRFARAIAARRDDAQVRERVRRRYGEDALIELTLVVAVSRVVPHATRVLGGVP